MQKIAPGTSLPTTGHPTSEELAAYIDGNLSQAEAAHVTKHLASCEDCYDVYSMATRFLLSEPAPVDNVVSFSKEKASRRRESLGSIGGRLASWGLPAAAAVVLLVVSGGIGRYLFLAPPPDLVTADVTASIPYQPGAQELWTGPRYRSGNPGGEDVEFDAASFRLGVQFVNLQVSLKTNDTQNASDAIAFILGLLESEYHAQDFKDGYTKLKTDLLKGKPSVDLLPEATRLAQESRESFDPPSLDLGQWVEAGRLAAMARNPTFFQRPETRMFLRRLRWNDKLGIHEIKLDPTTRESLNRISDVLSRGDLRPSDYVELEQQLRKILEVHYPQ